MDQCEAAGPASGSSTLTSGSSERRRVRIPPAEPLPRMTKSYVSGRFIQVQACRRATDPDTRRERDSEECSARKPSLANTGRRRWRTGGAGRSDVMSRPPARRHSAHGFGGGAPASAVVLHVREACACPARRIPPFLASRRETPAHLRAPIPRSVSGHPMISMGSPKSLHPPAASRGERCVLSRLRQVRTCREPDGPPSRRS